VAPRVPSRLYRDPLDRIWLTLAQRIGFHVERSADVYASTDGHKTLFVGRSEVLDADDCLAQMIFHELCHALVEGPDAHARADWGLCNQTERDVPREHACLRLQARLALAHGLMSVLAPTTEHREFYDQLGADPFLPRAESSVVAARLGLLRASRAPFAPHLEQALAATAQVARAALPFAEGEGELGSLWAVVDAVPPRHPLGFLPLPGGEKTCATCAWQDDSRGHARCRQAGRARVDPAWPACERWEDALDCQTCGACCRAAYDSVTVSARDPVRRKHPALVVVRDHFVELRREGDHCAALEQVGERYACRIYEDRPRPCREFTRGQGHCAEARRRVGLSL
jgi:hypothetical protein